MFKRSVLLVGVALVATPLTACSQFYSQSPQPQGTAQTGSSPAAGGGGGTLDAAKSRGRLACGVSGTLPGFSYVDQAGKYSGLDVDICRAIAAALFDDPNAVDFRNLNAKERFTALQAGEVDILSRNTTWTMSRDTSVGLEFLPVTFYDGQGVMVKKSAGTKDLKGLQGKAVCMETGTTTEQNFADQMRKIGVKYTPLVFEDANAVYAAYEQGRCQAVSTDRSGLVSRRTTLKNPQDNIILDALLSKEPLTPAVKNGDSRWFDAVKWTVFGLIEAEELGINSQNIDQFAKSQDPVVKRLLGTEGNLGQGAGLPNDFVARAVRKVGNYGEIYNRNLGPGTPFNLPRGQNDIWEKGGLHYAPPFR